jgi:hypothetical protein
MLAPHSIVLQAAVNEYDRLTLAMFDISKLCAVDGNPFNFIGYGHGADRPAK